MNLRLATRRVAAALTAFVIGASASVAQSSAEADANNPLASVTAFNIQNYYIDSFTDTSGVDGNQFWLRYATPMKLGDTN